jgi:hypothetical protein
VAVNDGADDLDAGQTLLIPAVYHPPVSHARARSRSKTHRATAASARKSPHSSKSAASVSQRTLHRRAAVRTASIAH